MSIKVMTEFVRKATIRILVYVYDDDEALVDATSVKISIVDPKGTVKENAATMNRTSPGTYEYFYTTTTLLEEGDWQIECDILDGSYHTFEHSHFNLSAGINE